MEQLNQIQNKNQLSQQGLMIYNRLKEVEESNLWLKQHYFEMVKDIQLILKKVRELETNRYTATAGTGGQK